MFAHRYSINSRFTVNSSLFLHQCGWEECKPEHAFGPVSREHHLIHLVFKGKGLFCVDDKKYTVCAGQGFLICPGQVTYYIADRDEPWHYGWMGFNGTDSGRTLANCKISRAKPVFSFNDVEKAEKCIFEMIECYGLEGNSFSSISKMFEFFSYMNPKVIVKKEQVVEEVMQYIEENYSCGITVNDIARHINLTRSQLFRIFKDALDASPQEYLLEFKLNKAASLLQTTSTSINEITALSGYGNASNFSRQFKKAFGYSPQEYRKRMNKRRAFLDGDSSIIDKFDE